MRTRFQLFIPLVFLFACKSGPDNSTKLSAPQSDSAANSDVTKVDFNNDLLKYSNLAGVIGLFEQEPMLCLSKIDSAPMQQVADRMSATYALIEREMVRTDAQPDGPAGQISYNNDVNNFKFGCFFLIAGLPARTPDTCKVVLLKPGRMLIYNHYGSYDQLYRSYDSIRSYCKTKGLVQSGPVREFYITDPAEEKDRSRWLTRIMVPVDGKN